ncbi:putative ArsR family transcriptional regulator [Bradyrhizobium sp. i1.15.2]|uniref:helix-turn-helix domain-containing protein n=1 Tax=Bradyrhizobium sp. i1.15.2 TaxID=3156362 RepID=UPI00339A3F0E
MDRLTELEAFIRTVDLGSQAAAAAALGLSRMAVGRQIQALERRLVRIPTKSPRRTDMRSPVDSETMSPTFPI